MPRADRQSAPKREMNKPSLGIAIAKTTEKKIKICFKVEERILFGNLSKCNV